MAIRSTKRLGAALVLTLYLATACGESDPVDPGTDDPGETTPSSIPQGDYPDIPLPTTSQGTNAHASDTLTTIHELATDFNPRLLGVLGSWRVNQAYAGQLFKTENVRTCFTTVFNGEGWSHQIDYRERRVDCPLIEGGAYSFVEFPARGDYIHRWLAANVRRAVLVEDGRIVASGSESIFRAADFDGGPFGHVEGDEAADGISARNGCELEDASFPPFTPCVWYAITNADVVRRSIATVPHIRRDIYWVKEGESVIVRNGQSVQSSYTFTQSWTRGSTRSETEEFGRSVSSEAGLSYQGLGAKVSGTLSQTFGEEVSINEAEEVEESFQMTVAAQTTAVFEIWNLTERYTFVNPDGTPFEDPSYTFSLPDLTRRATIATAWTSTEFPNS